MAEPNVFTRRQVLIIGGIFTAGAIFEAVRRTNAEHHKAASEAARTPGCILAPEQTEGPFYIDDHLVRRNISEGKPGVPLEMRLAVVDAKTCAPIPGAFVELWHADAGGNYSGFGPGAGDGTFLRGGVRTTDAGLATIETIYPGWYQGRTVHIHVKVHVHGNVVHTGQLYFDDALTDAVFKRKPYSRRGPRDTRNPQDAIYADGGRQSTLHVSPRGPGYVGRLALGIKA